MSVKIKMWIARMCQYALYFFVPIRKNRIMFYAHMRKGYVCNPKAIMNYLLQHAPDEYELIWVSSYPESCESINGITVVGMRSFAYFLSFIQTKFFVTNDMIDENLIKKKGQIFINTWHGGGTYKKVGIDTINESKDFARNFKKWYQRTDYFISSCAQCTSVYTKAFGLAREKFIEIGTPRNDIFFEEHNEIIQKVFQFYQIPRETKILLFAPSFRRHTKYKSPELLFQALTQLIEELKKSTDNNWVVLYRDHYYEYNIAFPYSHEIMDGNKYYDMQELLYVSDILVSDFSSSIWDFALTGKPIFLLEDALKEYQKYDRGFFLPYHTWPYYRINHLHEIIPIIKEGFSNDAAYQKHYLQMGSFEKGTACKEFAKLLNRCTQRISQTKEKD